MIDCVGTCATTLSVAMETKHFYIAQTDLNFLGTYFRIWGVPVTKLEPMSICHGGCASKVKLAL